jgi:HAE1 family hydrophobic/amphiphilic exporter-1
MIGLILLVGLAIKNGILLVDRTNRNRQHGMDIREALLEAGPARLRAIMMTSVTIAFALLPVALHFGEGAETRAPLAATVLGGVVSSTLLTLVLVPVMYTFLDGLAARNTRRLVRLFRWYFGIGARGAEAAVQRRLATPVESDAGGGGRR